MKAFLETKDCGDHIEAIVPAGATIEDAVDWGLAQCRGGAPLAEATEEKERGLVINVRWVASPIEIEEPEHGNG